MTIPRKIWWRICVAGLVTVLFVGGIAAYLRLSHREPESVTVRARELKQTIVSSGQVMPPAEVRLDSLLTSTVTKIAKREGDFVRAGELLVTLDDSEIAAAKAQAEAALAQARTGKTTLKATTLPQANEALAQVRASLREARSALDRERKLYQGGVVPRSAIEKAESAVSIYESQEKAALLQVQAASTGGSASLTASATVAVAEAQLAVLNVTSDRTKILAPMDGVISERLVEEGEVVRPGSPLLVLTARGRTRIVLEPDERNLSLIALGQKALVSAEAFPSESFEGIVGYIAPAVNGERGTIEVRLDVAKPPSYLRPNMTVSVELQIATRANALSLPLTAVQDLGTARPWVALVAGRGEIERRDVQLGLRGDDLVEIVGGVTDGDLVALEPPASLLAKPQAKGD